MNNKRIGWIIAESSNEGPLDTKLKLRDTTGRRVIAETRLQRANKKNRNGRFYDEKELFPQLVSERTKEMISTGWGSENGHPMSMDLVRQQTIDPNNVVAYILKVWTDKEYVMGNVRGSNLPIGEAFDMDLREGFLPAWSLRALGGINKTNRGAEVKDIKIITYDRVYYPSHPEAYTQKIVSEATSVYIDNEDNYEYKDGFYIPKTPNPTGSSTLLEEGIIEPITNQSVLEFIKEQSLNFKQICNEFEVFYDDIKMMGTDMVRLANKSTGNVFIVNLESFVQNEIMNYCDKMY